MEPIPMPTRRASTPQSMRCLACSLVTTLPPMTCKSGCCSFIHLMIPCWKVLSPWLLSTTTASTPAATSMLMRSRSDCRVPTAAATMSRPWASFVASGKSACFFRSVRATSATRLPDFVMMGNLPLLELRMISLASASSTPSSAVTRSCRFVMTNATRVLHMSSTKSVSRFVTRPRSLEPMLPSSVTGKPMWPDFWRSFSSSERSIVGLTQTGSMMKPLRNFFTLETSAA
mmetsp:Transcript_67971/g.153746  ORF Transcript_67971/g.153746 Transcript_67971/m.153746 type:complete len:230 (+) Transcript_67971:179-868(+)